jgi:integrase
MKLRLPRYVQAWVDPEGRPHAYFRRRGFPRVPLPGLPWSPGFMLAYTEALNGAPAAIGKGRAKPGSVAAIIGEFLDSRTYFGALAPGTQRMRRGILNSFRNAYGERPLALLPAAWIERLLDSKTPHAARAWLSTLRGLCQFAIKRGFLKLDPTRDLKARPIKTFGFHCWTDQEIRQFEAHHPIGTLPRLAFALLLFTAQRRGDVVRMGRQHLRGGALLVRQQKTGATLQIPVNAELQSAIDAMPAESLTFLTTTTGRPFGGNFFSERFRHWCDAAGLPKRCSAHGLRKAACRRLAEAGCTAHEIMSISGHQTMKELLRYTRSADQARLARSAMARTNLESKVSNTSEV